MHVQSVVRRVRMCAYACEQRPRPRPPPAPRVLRRCAAFPALGFAHTDFTLLVEKAGLTGTQARTLALAVSGLRHRTSDRDKDD